MEPKIITLEAFKVMGPQIRMNPMTANYKDLWENHFDPHQQLIEACAAHPGYYGVYFSTGERGMADFVPSMAVRDDSVAAPPLVIRDVRGGLFAVFECSMAEIGGVWGFIYGKWLPQSEEYEEDPDGVCFERYSGGQDPAGMRVTIHMPLKKKR